MKHVKTFENVNEDLNMVSPLISDIIDKIEKLSNPDVSIDLAFSNLGEINNLISDLRFQCDV